MHKYTLCPRCELNYILEDEGYCDVCKAELKIGPQLMFSVAEEGSDQVLCPICKTKYINIDEDMCSKCREKLEYEKNSNQDDVDKDDDWRQFLDDDEKVVASEDGEEELLLSQIEEEEAFDDMEEDIDPYTNEKIEKNKKVDDDDFDYAPIDESDFEDYEEEEEYSQEDDF